MHSRGQKTRGLWWAFVMVAALWSVPALYAGNEVMGELQFEGKSKVERTSGVWIDGGYVGYLKELKGSKKVLLLPGEHVITVRQDGYEDFTERVLIQPGERKAVFVTMNRAATGAMPRVKSTVKLAVNPTRAAVFVDGLFVGHVGEFEGAGRGMLIAPGPHKIRIGLPGYQTFETEISPLPNQKVEVKTDLIKDNAEVQDPMLKIGATSSYAAPPPPPPPPDPRGPQ
jgi:PEGA domain